MFWKQEFRLINLPWKLMRFVFENVEQNFYSVGVDFTMKRHSIMMKLLLIHSAAKVFVLSQYRCNLSLVCILIGNNYEATHFDRKIWTHYHEYWCRRDSAYARFMINFRYISLAIRLIVPLDLTNQTIKFRQASSEAFVTICLDVD